MDLLWVTWWIQWKISKRHQTFHLEMKQYQRCAWPLPFGFFCISSVVHVPPVESGCSRWYFLCRQAWSTEGQGYIPVTWTLSRVINHMWEIAKGKMKLTLWNHKSPLLNQGKYARCWWGAREEKACESPTNDFAGLLFILLLLHECSSCHKSAVTNTCFLKGRWENIIVFTGTKLVQYWS